MGEVATVLLPNFYTNECTLFVTMWSIWFQLEERVTMKRNNMKSSKNTDRPSDFENQFDQGDDLSQHFQFDEGTKTVNLDLPIWAIKTLDTEAKRRGVARQALIKMWIVDRIDNLGHKKAV